ncbi:cation transporter [Sphingosinicella sp. LHD-64]|uniref:cation transporter n=1 Tax=Sphingosinicella sp. LHD-64 TaxID=3072139 RepID=UPI00280E173C|nr:cation transporter [Sphingosinicella sp. LHD-64]MDQ8756709.1 cation transporter [Sphingosinicella sp. LHD-64]
MSAHCCHAKEAEVAAAAARRADVRKVLIVVLAINAAMFVVEFTAGLVAGSAALMADSADMFGDALVYAFSLYALDRSARWRAGAALAKGGFILVLGLAVLGQIGVKLAYGVPPETTLMLVFGGIALVANLACLRLLWRFRADDVNLSSTFECSRNDVIANVGVLVAAGGVAWTGAAWPDIAVAGVIAFLFLRSAVRVLREAWPQFRRGAPQPAE